jgi:hypothetical protein
MKNEPPPPGPPAKTLAATTWIPPPGRAAFSISGGPKICKNIHTKKVEIMVTTLDVPKVELQRINAELTRHLTALSELKAGASTAGAGLSDQLAGLNRRAVADNLLLLGDSLVLMSDREEALYEVLSDLRKLVDRCNERMGPAPDLRAACS